MERNQERRDEHEKRVPIRAAATLAENRDDAFEADAVNLSRGGMSLRSPCLPDLGARLWCRFEHPPSGSIIEAEGEVVWAQLEGESGEIGLAFTSLDPETEMLIEQIIAQHGSPTAAGLSIDASEQDRLAAELDARGEDSATPEPPREPTSAGRESAVSLPPPPSARVANLSLEGIAEPLSTHVAELSSGYAVFEQVLPLLKLGRSVSADSPELQGRRGAIAGVELRMMGHVPTLAVLVEFADGADGPLPALNNGFGEASFSSTDVPAVDESLAHDTEPDLDAPSDDSHPGMEPVPAHGVTAAEFSASPVARAAKPAQPKQLVLDVAPAPAAAPRMARVEPQPAVEEPMPSALASSAGGELRPSARGDTAAEKTARPVNHRLDATQVVELDDAADDADDASFGDDDPFAPAPPAWKPLALATMRALHALAGLLKIGASRAATLLGATGGAALPRARMFMVRARAVARQASIVIAPKLGAAKRMAAAQLGKKKRRTTSGGGGAARESNDTGSLVRTIGLGVLVTVIAGLGVYAVLPTSEPELELHRAVDAQQGEAGVSGGEVAPAEEPAAAQALDLAQPSANEPALPMPSAATVPAGSAFAVDVREPPRAKAAAAAAPAPKAAQAAPQAAPAPKAAPRAMRFGASTAPSSAQTFALRMSKPIASINGIADAGGFTVVIKGSLSLDRAGPISASHRGVARAMVLNKGDSSELTIRFADGKKPAYQVRADGQTLYVVIEDV
jgi:hypothetical protein